MAQNLMLAYQEAEALVAAGHLRQAADICRSMLDEHPDFPYGYYLMSSLFRATGTYGNALTFSQMAIQMQPENSAFHIQHGQILFSLGDNTGAESAFRTAHLLQPTDPIAMLLLADTMAQQDNFDDAILMFENARAARDIPEIDLHEGLCHMMKGAHDKAEKLFNRVIERAPENEWGHIQKGKLLIEHKRYSEAHASLARALKYNPNAYEALHGMAMVSEQQGQYDMATRYAMQAIQSNPNGWESHMQLGSLLLIQHQYAMAEQILSQAHGLQKDNVYITQLLLNALLRQHKNDQAKDLLAQALMLSPDDKVMRYFDAMLKGDAMVTAPAEYISNLFDHYADRFDHHLIHVLGYKVPGLLAQMAAEVGLPKDASLLDLGCGTGLVAEAFRDITSQRVGVDLSQKMLSKARDRKLYNALFAQDIVEFMWQCEQTFDYVVAADVLIYLGDVAPLFKAARAVLAQKGILLISIEREEQGGDYNLKPTGRYTQRNSYIEHLAAEEGYEIIMQQDMTVRMENDMPVAGMAYALKKRQTH
jgi:predicted TPR repeat methyltransferase/TolA-binding protein